MGGQEKEKSFYGAQMNARRFLFTFDLPLSPAKNDRAKGWKKGEKGRRREEIQTEGEREGRKEEERKRGEAGELLLLLPPYLLSPSLYFFSFCLSEGKLGGQLLLPRLQPPAALLTSYAAVLTGSRGVDVSPMAPKKGADSFFFSISFIFKRKKEVARKPRLE